MRCLIQRVKSALVDIRDERISEIDGGFLILLGVAPNDDEQIAEQVAKKAVNLRVFSDENGKMNLSLLDVAGSALIVSQFTLYADCKKGNRPSYTDACEPNRAKELYEYFCDCVSNYGVKVGRGVFGEDMQVGLVNAGPVTVMLDSDIICKR